MSERYSRLFSLPTNLYTEGSPVLIAAGALLKDNHTNKVLVQLKFRNISQKAIKSVKVKVNAYDTAKGQLDGIDAFSYLDLSVAANEEFGQRTPIHLPDATTRSFNVEILSVVYSDNEVFSPNTVSVAEAAPQDIIEGVQRVEAEKQAVREAIKAEKAKEEEEMIRSKQCQRIMICGFVAVASVLLSIILFSNTVLMPVGVVIRHYSVRYILALIVPCLCLLAAFIGKKNAAIMKPILIICIVLFAAQVVSIIVFLVGFDGRVSKELYRLAYQLGRYVNGIEFGADLRYTIRMLGKAPGRVMGKLFARMAPSFFAVLPNILCTTVLAIYSKKMK